MKWEYLRVWLDRDPQQGGQLDELGRQGWELVSVVYLPSNDLLAYFKKPLTTVPASGILRSDEH